MTKDILLRTVSFWIAALAGTVAALSIVSIPMRLILYPTTIVAVATAALLFLRIVFTRTYRHGIYATNQEVQGNDPWTAQRRKFNDAEWGIFGARSGPPTLLWLRAILVLGSIPMCLIQQGTDTEFVWLWLAGAFIAMELSLMHMALTAPRTKNRPYPL